METDCEYIALSYVWGVKDVPLLCSPPRVVLDVINFVRQLGYRYLWVDKYCVVQNVKTEQETKDYQMELQNMDNVYDRALFTLIDGGVGGRGNVGLYGVEPSRVPQQVVQAADMMQPLSDWVGTYMTQSDEPMKRLFLTPWNRRGWTYREGKPSWRLLVSLDRECVFQCGRTVRTESPAIVYQNRGLWQRRGRNPASNTLDIPPTLEMFWSYL